MRDSGSQDADARIRSHVEAVLTSKGWLSACSPRLRQRLLEVGTATRFEPGEGLFRIGDVPQGIYGVAAGAVHIAMPADDGQELVIYHADTGFWVGDLELFSEQPRMATVTAAAPTLCLYLSRRQLRALLDSDPEFYRDFYQMSYENGRTIMRALANMTVTGSDKRLALRLLQYDEATTDPDGWITVAQSQLAMTTALSVPTLERVLRRMAKAGLVEIGYGKVRILDRAELARTSKS
ncbi:MAG: Crp/Fnr family transcriptional regulator [Pseudomonadota bacterium]